MENIVRSNTGNIREIIQNERLLYVIEEDGEEKNARNKFKVNSNNSTEIGTLQK